MRYISSIFLSFFVSTSIALAVPPTFVADLPLATQLDEGQTLNVSVIAQSDTEARYRWYLNDRLIRDSASPALEIRSINYSDNLKKLLVKVSNASGEITSRSMQMLVAPLAPTITRQPRSRSLSEKSIVAFDVTVRTSAPAQYQWFFAPSAAAPFVAVANATKRTYRFRSDLSLSGSQVRVLIQTAGGSIFSDPATLTVTRSAFRRLSISGVMKVSGSPVKGARLSITKNNTVLTDDDGSFTFTGLVRGTYQIVAVNEGHTVTSAPIVLGDFDVTNLTLNASCASKFQYRNGICQYRPNLTPPATVTGRSTASGKSVRLTWSNAQLQRIAGVKSPIIRYRVFRSTRRKSVGRLISEVRYPSYLDVGVTPGRMYYYSILTVDDIGRQTNRVRRVQVRAARP
jgi:hypothetical protein